MEPVPSRRVLSPVGYLSGWQSGYYTLGGAEAPGLSVTRRIREGFGWCPFARATRDYTLAGVSGTEVLVSGAGIVVAGKSCLPSLRMAPSSLNSLT